MNLEDFGIPLICPEVGPEFWVRVRAAESRDDLRDVIEPVVAICSNAELGRIAAQKIFESLKRFANPISNAQTGSMTTASDPMFPPIQDAVLFAAIDRLFLPAGFWKRMREESSWPWCRKYLVSVLDYLPDGALCDLLEGCTLPSDDGKRFDLACERVYAILREVAEFKRIGLN